MAQTAFPAPKPRMAEIWQRPTHETEHDTDHETVRRAEERSVHDGTNP